MWQDFRHALRAHRRTPGFFLVTTVSLALAIGANGAIFSLIDGLWLRPPGVPNPGSIVRIFTTSPTERRGDFSFPEYRDLRDRSTSFSGMVARGHRGAYLQHGADAPELLTVEVVSANFFSVMDVHAQAGRLFTPRPESNLEQEPAVVLGYAFWQRQFGADPSIVGRSLQIRLQTPVQVTVIGVLPRAFRDLDAASDHDVWMPLQTWERLTGKNELEQRESRWLEVVARLKPEVSPSRAAAEIRLLGESLARTEPATSASRSVALITDRSYRLESGGVNAIALIGVVLLVVLITCVNLANLLLARAISHVRDTAVRVALGATRWRIARQLLIESALLGVVGAAAGVLVSAWLIGAIPAVVFPPPGVSSRPYFASDQRMLIFTMAVTLITTVLFGVVPSWLGSHVDVAPALKREVGPAGSARQVRGVRAAMVVSQVALSMALLSSAVVLGESFLETRRADIGFARTPTLTALVVVPQLTAAEERVIVSRLMALPGVTGVALAIRAPLSLSGGGLAQTVGFPDRPTDRTSSLPSIKYNAVSANYFRVLGTRVLKGRVFSDNERTAPVVVVSETFTQQYFPGEDAVGRVITFKGGEYRIVGVVQDVRINNVGEKLEPYFYMPFAGTFPVFTLLVTTERDVALLAAPVRDTLKQLDPRLVPRQMATMADLIDFSARDYRMTAALVGVLGLIGLLMTALGVYGVVSYNADLRAKELGIRSAIGATRGQLVTLVVGDGIRLTCLGLACGLPLALLATRLLASFLFDTAPWHAPSFLLAASAVAVATIAASAIPAGRASGVDVIVALRDN